MLILNESNQAVDLNLIPDVVDMHFWVFDNTTHTKDFICQPLLMIESFYSSTIKLRLTVDSGRKPYTTYFINVPSDYQLLIGEPTHGDLEINPITSLSGRNFRAFSLNPLSSFRPEFLHVETEDVLPIIKWFMPKMKTGAILCVPLSSEPKPPCIYLVRDMPKALEIIKMADVG
jgi:hypothetical protein